MYVYKDGRYKLTISLVETCQSGHLITYTLNIMALREHVLHWRSSVHLIYKTMYRKMTSWLCFHKIRHGQSNVTYTY